MSLHPAACLAAAKSFWSHIGSISLDFIQENAHSILSTSPVPYIRDAELCRTLFISDDTSEIVSGVNTNSFVDHEEPLSQWPLGDMPDGYEYCRISAALSFLLIRNGCLDTFSALI